MYDYETRLFDKYNGEAQSYEDWEADTYDELLSDIWLYATYTEENDEP